MNDVDNISKLEMLENPREVYDKSLMDAVRRERNRLLAATDWRFRSDMTPSQAWIDYCAALRNVPEQEGFPWDVQWPVQPE